MTAQRSRAEVDHLDARAAAIRAQIYRKVRPHWPSLFERWPESVEKDIVSRLWDAHAVYSSKTCGNETKYNVLRDAIRFAEEELEKLNAVTEELND